MIKKLFLDLDGLLADFDKRYTDLFGAVAHEDDVKKIMWDRVFSTPNFFRDLPVCDGAKYFFSNVEELNPIILTSCPSSRYEEVAAQKRDWVRKHLGPDILMLPVRGSQYKPLFMHAHGDILIDDYKPNVRAWGEAGGIAVKHDNDFAQTWLDLMKAMKHEETHISIRAGEETRHYIHHDVGIDA